jgi:putative glutamine amidotransferase
MRPLIGITAYVEQARWGVWDTKAALVPYAYVQQVTDAGGRAVLVPPASEPAQILRVLDGLLLAGGADIDPVRYGEDAHPETTGLRPDRDECELELVAAALEADMPVLGVCRGMQLMTVAAGGRLHQHLPDLVGHDDHRPAPGVYGEHGVRIDSSSRLASVLGEQVQVRSYHHQGVIDAGKMDVVGWADDGAIEAVEDQSHPFALGVLWHPEAGQDPRLFRALVAAAQN